MERHITRYSERLINVYLRNFCQIRETLFDKLDSFGNKYTREQKFFRNSALFDSKTSSHQEETFRNTKTTTWIRKKVPIFVFFLRRCWWSTFSLQLWSLSPRCILHWISQRSSFTERNSNKTFVSWYCNNDEDLNGQFFGETQPTSQSTGTSQFSSWIYWTFLVVQLVWIQSWWHTKLQKQKDSATTNSLIILTKCR